MNPITEMEIGHYRGVLAAYDVVSNTTLSRDAVLKRVNEYDAAYAWLRAEARYKDDVQSWLLAEKRHIRRQQLLTQDYAYIAAARGWQAMRDTCINLDGVDEFASLSELLQDRYATFAQAVLQAVLGDCAGSGRRVIVSTPCYSH